MLVLGGQTLKDFALAMLIGEILGTWSSFGVASPLLAIWKTREKRWARIEQKYASHTQQLNHDELNSVARNR
jgi:preprotein translocase subunit SecF